MCRHAVYLGPDISLQQFLIDPPHSLYLQSRHARELKYAELNADGFGFGWFDSANRPATYTSPLPVWADHNLPALARSMDSPLWLGEVRSATIGNPVHAFNTQPFCDDHLLFVHNGYVRCFHEKVRPSITAQLSPAIAKGILGNTDSEYLFALLRQLLSADPDCTVPEAMRTLFARVEALTGSDEALLNLLVTDGQCVYASRHAINHEPPSLYYTLGDPQFPGGRLVASEAFSPHGSWQAVPEGHFIIMERDTTPLVQAI